MFIRRAVASKSGFVINRVPIGNFILKISHIGYRDTSLSITLRKEDSLYSTGTIKLSKSDGQLLEVVIKSVIPPVIEQNDTIIYNTSAFQTRPNAPVEELLKKLPGVEVDKDGNVTVRGERVQKILIDGKEFLFNDPKIATQNLLADMVQKVEVFNEKSEKAKLTGIADDNPPKALNLRLKPDKKNGIFGDISGGYTNIDRYRLSASTNYFNRDAYIFATLSSSNGSLEGGDGLRNNIKNLSLSYQNSWNNKLQFNGAYSLGTSDARNSTTGRRETLFGDSSLLQDRSSFNNSHGSVHSFNMKVNYKIDSFNAMDLASSISFNQNENAATNESTTQLYKENADYRLNNAVTKNSGKNNANGINLSLNYHRSFRKQGRYLGINLNNGNTNNQAQTELSSATHIYDNNGLVTDSLVRMQRSDPSAGSSNLGLSITYTEPLVVGEILDFSYALSQSAGKNDQQTFNFNPATGKFDDLDSLTSTSFSNRSESQIFAAGYNNKKKKKIHYQLGVSIQRTSQDNDNDYSSRPDIKQTFNNVAPRASFLYNINKQNKLTVSYTGSSAQPSIEQLQPISDYSNPLFIRVGNPNLKTEFNNAFGVGYKYFNKKKTQNLSIQTGFSNMINRIVPSVKVNVQGIQEEQYVNVDGNYNLNGRIIYSFNGNLTKDPRKGRMSFDITSGYSRGQDLVNGQSNLRQNIFANQKLGITNYRPIENLDIDFSAELKFNRAFYSIHKNNGGSLFSHNYRFNCSYELPGKLRVSSNLRMQFNNGRRNFSNTQSAVWNAHLSKQLFSNQGELKLSAFDILNKSNAINRVIGDNYIETNETNVVRRIFVLSFLYRFRGIVKVK